MLGGSKNSDQRKKGEHQKKRKGRASQSAKGEARPHACMPSRRQAQAQVGGEVGRQAIEAQAVDAAGRHRVAKA